MKKTIAALALSMATLSAPAFAQGVPGELGITTLTAAEAAGVAAALVGLLIIVGDDDDTTTTTTTTTTGTP